MPPKIKFTKQDAVRAAMEIVQEEGLDGLTMRKVAQRLGSSLQPVYSCFDTKFEMEQKVISETKKILTDHANRMYTDSRPLNMAIGLVLFARDYSRLFRSIFLQDREFKGIFKEFNQYHVGQMETIERFARMDNRNRQRLLNRLWMFTFGFATLMCTGLVEDTGDDNVIATLHEVGSQIIEGALTQE